MLKVENIETYGWEAAIRGMRNPMNSWDKSDSLFLNGYNCETGDADAYTIGGDYVDFDMLDSKYEDLAREEFQIGPNDKQLMRSLAKGGPVHAKYRRMITITMDITAPLYWWKEFDTYKVGTVANSCSTMHKIAAKEFELDDFSHEHLTDWGNALLSTTINTLNETRDWYLKYDAMPDKDKKYFGPKIKSKKDLWWQLIQLLPSSYNQKRTVQLNYEVAHNIYVSRKDHKLDCWHTLCDELKNLPLAKGLIYDVV